MTARDEARSKLIHAASKPVTITFDGMELEVAPPSMPELLASLKAPSDFTRDAMITLRCLRSGGAPVFESIDEVLNLRADRARIVDVVAAKVRELLSPQKGPGFTEAASSPEEVKAAALNLQEG